MLRRRALLKFIFDTLWTCGARAQFASIVCCGLIGCRMRRATSVKRGKGGHYGRRIICLSVILFGDHRPD